MIGEKRGFFVVVVLVILLSFSGLAGWVQHCGDGKKCITLWFVCDEVDTDSGENDCDSGLLPDDEKINCDHPDNSCGSTDPGITVDLPAVDECDLSGEFILPPTDQKGCWVLGAEEDAGGDADNDDCAASTFPVGKKWGHGQILIPRENQYFGPVSY